MNASVDLYDVNVWISLILEDHPQHEKARKVLDFPDRPAFCRITQLGVLRLLTNSKVMGKKTMKTTEAFLYLRKIEETLGVFWIHEQDHFESLWENHIKTWNISPSDWTDAYLATLAEVARVRLVTLDRDFDKFPGKFDLLILA